MSGDLSFLGMALDFVFGHEQTPEERLKEMKLTIRHSKRELRKQIRHLETEDENVLQNLREAADSGNATRKSLYTIVMRHTRIGHEIRILDTTMDKLTACEKKLTNTSTTEVLTRVFTKMTLCMTQMNSAKTLNQMTNMMVRFDIENQKLETMQELIDEKLEEVYEDEDEENEEMADEILDKILAEQGIKIDIDLPTAPKSSATATTAGSSSSIPMKEGSLGDKDLEEEFNRIFGDSK